MARLARAVVPGIPSHVTHRGNRRGEIFFCDEDRRNYLYELGQPDPLLGPARPFTAGVRDPLTGRFIAWGDWLARGLAEEELEALRLATRTGRPCGSAAFVKELETALARPLAPPKRGPKPKPEDGTPEIPGLF